jgi:signal transduction histidine kinase
VLVVAVPALAVVLSEPGDEVFPVVAGLFGCAVLPLRHRWPRIVVVLCLPALAGGLGWAPTLVALYGLGWRRTRFPPLVPWILLVVAAAVAPVLVMQSLGAANIVLMLAFAVLASGAPAVMGALVATQQQLTESLHRVQEATAAESHAKAEQARAQERARISREIHDAVGHHATLIAVEAAALAATSDDPQTKEAAGRVRGLAKEALGEMRTALGLTTPDQPEISGLESIPALVARARESGVDVQMQDEVPVNSEIAPGVGRAAYRVVQEALTNASKHAAGAGVKVRLEDGDGSLRITVTNDVGTGVPVDVGGGGAGLEGLSERVRMAGGEMHAEPRAGGGFEVSAVLPRK